MSEIGKHEKKPKIRTAEIAEACALDAHDGMVGQGGLVQLASRVTPKRHVNLAVAKFNHRVSAKQQLCLSHQDTRSHLGTTLVTEADSAPRDFGAILFADDGSHGRHPLHDGQHIHVLILGQRSEHLDGPEEKAVLFDGGVIFFNAFEDAVVVERNLVLVVAVRKASVGLLDGTSTERVHLRSAKATTAHKQRSSQMRLHGVGSGGTNKNDTNAPCQLAEGRTTDQLAR